MKLMKEIDSENTFIRDESKLHKAPLGILYWNMFSPIIIILFMIIFIFSKNIIIGTLMIICILFDLYCDYRYIYQENLQISINKNANVVYSYNLNKDFVPSKDTRVRISIKNITKVIIRKNIAIIWGDIEEKRPLVKTKKYKKIKINIKMENSEKTKEIKNILRNIIYIN